MSRSQRVPGFRVSRRPRYARVAVAVALMAATAVVPTARARAADRPTTASFTSVSCPSTTFCMAVGGIGFGSIRMLGERWDGARWTRVDPLKPAGGKGARLGGVSCPTPTLCFAAGSYNRGDLSRTMIMRWDGSDWTHVPSPNLSPAIATTLGPISCSTATSCFAIGSTDDPTDGRSAVVVVERWDGNRWSIVKLPKPSGAGMPFLSGISCASPTSCFAAGTYPTATRTATKPLIYRWNGIGWSIVPSPPFAGNATPALRAISCPTATSCYIAGAVTTRTKVTSRLIEHWNGTRWSIVNLPKPVHPAQYDELFGISCSSDAHCMAVGYHYVSGDAETFVQRWDGTHWKVVSSPSPESRYSQLNSVSCASESRCTAVGYTYVSDSKPLAEQWNGTRWAITVAPPPNAS